MLPTIVNGTQPHSVRWPGQLVYLYTYRHPNPTPQPNKFPSPPPPPPPFSHLLPKFFTEKKSDCQRSAKIDGEPRLRTFSFRRISALPRVPSRHSSAINCHLQLEWRLLLLLSLEQNPSAPSVLFRCLRSRR